MTRNSGAPRVALFLTAAVAAMWGAGSVGAGHSGGPPRPDSLPGAGWSGELREALPTGVRRLLADLAWLGAVQHYGQTRLEGGDDFPRLAGRIQLAARLDPGFRAPAVEGALLLAEAPPLGAGDPEAASALLSGWTARHPRDWAARLFEGLVRHWHLADPGGAARLFRDAGREPGAPAWFEALAARLLVEAGSRDAARILWRAALDTARSPRERANARTHLRQLEALDRRDELEGVVGRFRAEFGREPRGWEDVAEAGLLGAVPLDPAGAPFLLGPEGAVEIAAESPLAGYPGRAGR